LLLLLLLLYVNRKLVLGVQVMAESRVGELEDHLRRARAQVEDQSRQLQDANALKARLGQENLELHRHLQDMDSGNAALTKGKNALQQELEETKMKLDDETRVVLLLNKINRRIYTKY